MLLAGIVGALLVAPAAAADRAHTVITANTGQVNTIDPIRSDYAQTYDVVARLYSPLVTYDVQYNVIGDLASDYKVADDAKSIDFTLRDASFHSGNKVTAADVAYSFDRTNDVEALFARPQHPYTQGLLEAIPRLDQQSSRLRSIPGAPPTPFARPPGCHFNPRCPKVMEICRSVYPATTEAAGSRVACHLYGEAAHA
ncbi:MAG: hypothetical protein ABS80_22070 [Pseudonocardia sp. SCN 72-51]|nr:MAG: hypothetical protein ABS80_22070 [Pseudonocardia sp. SCN 72-51]